MSVDKGTEKKTTNIVGVERTDRYIRLISNWFNWLAMLGFAAMAFIAFVDVIGTKFFKFPFPGGFEITSLVAIVMIAFALPYTQSVRGHIEVELLVERFPKRAQAVIAMIISFLGMVLFALATWQMFKNAGSLLDNGNTTAVIGIPLYPFAYGASLCFFMSFLLLVLDFIKQIEKMRAK